MAFPVLPVVLIGGGLSYLAFSKPSSATKAATAAAAQQATTQANQAALAATANAQAFNAQAQALGLSQQDAQAAYDLGLTPQEYVNAGLQGTAGGSNPIGTPAYQPPLDPSYQASTSGNLLEWYGF